MSDITRFSTDRLIIMQRDEDIADKLLTFYNENMEEFEQFDPLLSDNFYTEKYQAAVIRYERNEIDKGLANHFYVYLKGDTDTIIGNIDFFRIRPNPFYSTILSYRFHHDYWGKGYAKEAIYAAINMMFANYDIHRIEARVSKDNPHSIKLLNGLGFTYEGVERESVKIRGIFKDHLRFALLSTDIT